MLYTKDVSFIDLLPDEEAGKLLKNIFHFHSDGKIKELTGLAKATWAMQEDYMGKNFEKRETQRRNGSKGGRPTKKKPNKNPNETQLKPNENPKKASVSVSESVSESVSKTKTKTETESNTHKESPQDGGGVCVHPTEQEIIDYCNQKGFSLSSNTFTAEFFLGYYKDKGVSIEHTWQARLDDWIERNKAKPVHTATVSQDKPKVKKTNFSNFHERKYDYDKLEFLLTGHGGVNRDAKEAYEMLNNTVISGGLKDYQKIDLPENDGVIHEDSDDELPFP